MMTNDFQQIYVVVKNELIKSVRGKKFIISLLIVLIVFMLITGLQMMLGTWSEMDDNVGRWVDTYFELFPLVITLVVALLSSIAIVSEFEERTALILFTRPIRRTSIFIGKIASCVILEAFIILIYYLLASIVGFIKLGSVPADIIVSYAISVMYVFAASGIAFVISAFFKKGSVCTIISLLILLVVMPIISMMVASDGGENWYMIDQAADTSYTCFPEYVDMYNETLEAIDEVIGSAAEILKGFTSDDIDAAVIWLGGYVNSPEFYNLDTDTQRSLIYLSQYLNISTSDNIHEMVNALGFITDSSLLSPMENPDTGRSILVLIIWGIIGYFIAWVKFVRREF